VSPTSVAAFLRKPDLSSGISPGDPIPNKLHPSCAPYRGFRKNIMQSTALRAVRPKIKNSATSRTVLYVARSDNGPNNSSVNRHENRPKLIVVENSTPVALASSVFDQNDLSDGNGTPFSIARSNFNSAL
jgi:hypothetical protein